MSLGMNIKARRTSLGFTQEDICQRLSSSLGIRIPLSTYRNWEQDKNAPPQEVLVALVKILSTSSDYLFGIISDHEPYPPAVPSAAKMADGFDVSDLSDDDKNTIAEYIELLRLKRRMEREGDEK